MIDIELPPRPTETVPIVCDGPFSPGCRAWQIQPPTDALVLVVKTTLTIVPDGVATPIEEQEPLQGDVPHRAPEGGVRAASLRYASDFAPTKRKADVLLVGHAHAKAPGATVARVELGLGRALRAAIAVVGDREWRDGVPSEPRRFTTLPLTFERAFGGPGYAANPHGLGVVNGITGGRLPNLEHPARPLRYPADRPPPRCFAPMAETTRAASVRMGTYDAAWQTERWPYFPRDFDFAYFNVAHPELQIPFPRGDEEFSLAGVHPKLPVVGGRLPGLVPHAYAQLGRTGAYAFRAIPLSLDTVWFDADAMRVALVWRGSIDVSTKDAPEIASLFVTAADSGAAHEPEAAQARFFELTGAGAPILGSGTPDAGRGAQRANEPPPRAAQPGDVAAPPAAPPSRTRLDVQALVAGGGALVAEVLAGCDLSRLDLSGRDLRGAILHGARIDGANLDGADLRAASLSGASLVGASLKGADLRGVNLSNASLAGADLSGAALDDATLAHASAADARFASATLARANLTDADLDRANFEGASAASADLSGASLVDGRFARATLDDAQLYGARASGCAFDDASLQRFRADDAALDGATFARADATAASFRAANLQGASFADATLSDAVLDEANLDRATLTRALARGARLRLARLTSVRATHADFFAANFERADLSSADLSDASLHGAELLDANVAGARFTRALVTGTKLAR